MLYLEVNLKELFWILIFKTQNLHEQESNVGDYGWMGLRCRP